MRNRAVKYAKLALLFALSCLTFIECENANLLGQDFRIDSQVYVSGKNLPVSENITLFSSGIIYDFQLSNGAAADAIPA